MRRALLVLAILVVPLADDSEGASVKCSAGMPCSLSITFTGTIVPSSSLTAVARDGVLVVSWSTTGLGEPASGERWAFYDRRLVGVHLALRPDGRLDGYGIGSSLAWVGEPGPAVAAVRR